MEQNHTGKIALITGANNVLAGARNTDLGQSAAARLRAGGAEANDAFTQLRPTVMPTLT